MCTATQESTLGADLWNVSYDGALCVDMLDSNYLVGYVDDVAAVIIQAAQRKQNLAKIRSIAWLDSYDLKLAMEKSELLHSSEYADFP